MNLQKKFISFILAIMSAMALSSNSALDAYNQSASSKDTWAHGEYVFFRIEVQTDANESAEEQEEKLLEKQLDVLVNYISSEVTKIRYKCAPFNIKLAKFILGEPEIKFGSLNSSIVHQVTEKKRIVNIIAFEKKNLEELKEKVLREARDITNWPKEKWAKLLKKSYDSLKTFQEKRTFLHMLGCPLVNVLKDDGSGEFGNLVPSCEGAWNELQEYLKYAKGEGPFFSKHKNLLWSNIHQINGLFYPAQWKQEQDDKFKMAKELFNKGRDLPKILELLSGSIAANPLDAEKWCYLGGALLANNMPQDALVAYVQAYRFAPGDEMAWKGILKSCEQAGLKEHAKGLPWYQLMLK